MKIKSKNTKHAFTLVELIVVITILAILWTIAFISLQWYSKEARDSARLVDARSLIWKINIENARGIPLSELLTWSTTSTITINKNSSAISNIWMANFEYLREDRNNFQDPTNGIDYPIAFAEWWSWKWSYSFLQIATVSEKNNVAMVLWNYYLMDKNDSPSLFLIDGDYIVNWKLPLPYNIDNSWSNIWWNNNWNNETDYWETTLPSGSSLLTDTQAWCASGVFDIRIDNAAWKRLRLAWCDVTWGNPLIVDPTYWSYYKRQDAENACTSLWAWWRLPTWNEYNAMIALFSWTWVDDEWKAEQLKKPYNFKIWWAYSSNDSTFWKKWEWWYYWESDYYDMFNDRWYLNFIKSDDWDPAEITANNAESPDVRGFLVRCVNEDI